MAVQVQPYITFDEYLLRERQAETRSEYVNGEIVAMAAPSPEHELIVANLVGALNLLHRDRGCFVFGSNMRLYIPLNNRGRYPDVSVACGQMEFYPGEPRDTLLNPILLIEVLAKSTEALDRGVKSDEYRSIATLREYLLVAQDRKQVEHYVRQSDNHWLLTIYTEPQQVIQFPSLNCQLTLAEIYAKLELLRGQP
jgi:Uma2 family endonuclease